VIVVIGEFTVLTLTLLIRETYCSWCDSGEMGNLL